MTRPQQRAFIHELIANVRADLLKQLPLIPEEWDGVELRQWVADTFHGSASYLDEPHNRIRKRNYKNAVLVMGRI